MKIYGSVAGIALVLIYIVGSGLWVNTGDNWYRSLNQPSWQPPDFIFGVIWPYNFVVLAIASVIISSRLSSVLTVTWLSIFAVTVAAALTWAYQFYVPHNLSFASIALFATAALTLPLVAIAFKASVPMGIALLPYQGWVITASFLSYTYSKLN